MTPLTGCDVRGDPPPWSVALVDRFVVSVLGRMDREGARLPHKFRMSMCPWGERNAVGGTPAAVKESSDPRFRIVHFTGCSRPYLVAVFAGDDARARQQVAMAYLPWSEHYEAEIRDATAILNFIDSTEEVDEPADEPAARTLYELARSGELAEL